ncbi:MAG: trypsin-like peptidase domain-containing protein [Bacteroidia bacterium]|nr:trypsin-like peptidase domain-containing protein [Bacteroidia bacterium]
MKKIHILILFLLMLSASIFGAYLFNIWFYNPPQVSIKNPSVNYLVNTNSFTKNDSNINFIKASKKCTPSVVFIKTESQQYRRSSIFWGFDFDPFGRIGKVASTGSGVILSDDGYIVTNHHVVKNADKIQVVVSDTKKSYIAELIGADPSSDLALLKIDCNNLTSIQFSSSDDVEIGEWVLAVGNPFNLTSTVTAGIVSAKGRNINIVNNQFPIESFIQTDAAINPGNSGGALVNLNGDLIGVNTAIASKTGSYVGYGFAIPSNIVSKIIEDLKQYGIIQRGFLGIDVEDIDGDMAEKLKVNNGVLIKKVNFRNEESTKKIEAGDIIVKFDGKLIEAKSNFDEFLAFRRPGDIINLEIFRDGELINTNIVLVNKEGTTDKLRKQSLFSETLGGEFEPISRIDKQTYGIENGVKVTNITNGKLRQMNITDGFIFTRINNKAYSTANDLIYKLEMHKGQIRIEGISSNGSKQYLSFTFR